MSLKSSQYSAFSQKVLERKINLTHAENSAVTMYFGVVDSDDLITERSVQLYRQGEAIVEKILETL